MKRYRVEPARFESEAHLCDVVVSQAVAAGWRAFPEVAGWDLLLVAPGDSEVAPRVGVEAKLRASFGLLEQAHHRFELGRSWRNAVDAAIVAVPAPTPHSFDYVASRLGLHAYSFRDGVENPALWYWLRELKPTPHAVARIEIPEFVAPGARGGRPSPSLATPWRIGAVRACMFLREQGWITRKQIKSFGIDPGYFCDRGAPSLVVVGAEGREKHYGIGPDTELPDAGWEWLAAQIAERERVA